MVLGGLWHGAGWTFVLWGAYHGILLIVFRLFRKRHEVNRGFHTGMDRYFIIKAFFMFQIICVSWIFFRAADMEQVTLIFQQIWHLDIGDFFNAGILETFYKVMFFSAVPLFVMVVADLKERWPMHYDFSWATSSLMIKSGVYGGLTYLMCIYGAKEQSFIYFQF